LIASLCCCAEDIVEFRIRSISYYIVLEITILGFVVKEKSEGYITKYINGDSVKTYTVINTVKTILEGELEVNITYEDTESSLAEVECTVKEYEENIKPHEIDGGIIDNYKLHNDYQKELLISRLKHQYDRNCRARKRYLYSEIDGETRTDKILTDDCPSCYFGDSSFLYEILVKFNYEYRTDEEYYSDYMDCHYFHRTFKASIDTSSLEYIVIEHQGLEDLKQLLNQKREELEKEYKCQNTK